MIQSEILPEYLEAEHAELRKGMELLVAQGTVTIRKVLNPDADGWPGVKVGRGCRWDTVRQQPGHVWLVGKRKMAWCEYPRTQTT